MDRQSRDPSECEVYLVEGDSAGGSAKLVGIGGYMILPLRGKILNVERQKWIIRKVFQNQEIQTMIRALELEVEIIVKRRGHSIRANQGSSSLWVMQILMVHSGH